LVNLKNYKKLKGFVLVVFLIPFFTLGNLIEAKADNLPAGTNSSFGPYPSSLTVQVIVVSNPGPQTQTFQSPPGPVNKIFTTVTSYVSGAKLYFDSGGTTYSVSVSPNSNALYTFASPLSISNVRMSIDNRGYPDDALHFGYESAQSNPDSDGDGITDASDSCPSQTETFNGYQDTDGCPDQSDNLPSGASVSTGQQYPGPLNNVIFSNSGPQTKPFPNPSGPVNSIWATVTTYVQGAVLYFDSGGTTYSKSIGPNSNTLITFSSPISISNVRISIQDRGYSNDQGNVAYGIQSAPPDSDNDGIPDNLDSCINQPENYNNYQDTDGCPDTPPSNNLPSGASVQTGQQHQNNLINVRFTNPGPQTKYFPSPSGSVTGIFSTVTTYVQNAVLYFDSGGTTYSALIGPNSNTLISFSNAMTISNVRISIQDRGYSNDQANVEYRIQQPIDPDSDGDGFKDSVDQCDYDKEDFDGYQDNDGCPDPSPPPLKSAAASVIVTPSSMVENTLTNVTVSGKITDSNVGSGIGGKPIKISLYGNTVTVNSDSNGFYRHIFSNLKIPKGTWNVEARFSGDNSYKEAVVNTFLLVTSATELIPDKIVQNPPHKIILGLSEIKNSGLVKETKASSEMAPGDMGVTSKSWVAAYLGGGLAISDHLFYNDFTAPKTGDYQIRWKNVNHVVTEDLRRFDPNELTAAARSGASVAYWVIDISTAETVGSDYDVIFSRANPKHHPFENLMNTSGIILRITIEEIIHHILSNAAIAKIAGHNTPLLSLAVQAIMLKPAVENALPGSHTYIEIKDYAINFKAVEGKKYRWYFQTITSAAAVGVITGFAGAQSDVTTYLTEVEIGPSQDAEPPTIIMLPSTSGVQRTGNAVFDWKATDNQTPENKIVYSYMLSPLDKSWSDWSSDSSYRKTGLPDGHYLFLIKAKDKTGNEAIARNTFTIVTSAFQITTISDSNGDGKISKSGEEITVKIKNVGTAKGKTIVMLKEPLPQGWSIEPSIREITLDAKKEGLVKFSLFPSVVGGNIKLNLVPINDFSGKPEGGKSIELSSELSRQTTSDSTTSKTKDTKNKELETAKKALKVAEKFGSKKLIEKAKKDLEKAKKKK